MKSILKRILSGLLAVALCFAGVSCAQTQSGKTELKLSRERVDLLPRGEFALKAETLTVNGRDAKIGELEWLSEDETVAKVSAEGVVTAVSEGQTVVFATDKTSGVRSAGTKVRVYAGREEIDLQDETQINYYGRNIVSEKNGITFLNTAGSFEFNFIGTECSARLHATAFDLKLKIYADGVAQAQMLKISPGTKQIDLAAGLADGLCHTIRAVKVNSAAKGALILNGIDCNGAFVDPPQKPALKFEVYGDSITAGYGVNAIRGEGDTIANEDGTAAYPYLVAERFGAQVHEQCASGISAVVPVSSWGWKEGETVSDLYDTYALNSNRTKWDFSSYQADVILLCMGNNDYVGCMEGNGTLDGFTDGYVQFIRSLREKNQDAYIVICDGMMGQYLSEQFETVVSRTGDGKVYFLNMTPTETSGAGGHPGVAGQRAGAEELAGFLIEKGICSEQSPA